MDGVPRMCISTTVQPSSATVGSMLSSSRPPETSLTMCAPASMQARATDEWNVSMLMHASGVGLDGEARKEEISATLGKMRVSSSEAVR